VQSNLREEFRVSDFEALVVEKDASGVRTVVRRVTHAELPDEDVLVEVEYSGLNYKDGLAVQGSPAIVRRFPLVPGIEFAGKVVESRSPAWKPGDRVVLGGWGVGERFWGGYAKFARAKPEWLEPHPEGFTAQEAMGIGVAGITAMQCVLTLEERGVRKEHPILVTGAGGGVGSLAVAILGKLGYHVVASTGRRELDGYLKDIGASEVIDRSDLSSPKRPLEAERWGGAIDNVGGDTLAGLLPAMRYASTVAAVGLTGGSDFKTTVFPFILRAVQLVGIDSVHLPRTRREYVWERLRGALPKDTLAKIVQVAPFAELPRLSAEITSGKTKGRVVIKIG
jgi:acrylyl-CoA reductase (NADPH)